MNQLTLSLEEHHANRSVSQDLGKDLKTQEETLPSPILDYLTTLNPNISSGKMSLEFCPQTKEKTLAPSSGRFKKSGMGSPTELWMLNISEYPKDVKESLLLDVLQGTGEVQQRYSLSPKACRGILRRADRKGKILPKKLEEALLQTTGGLRE